MKEVLFCSECGKLIEKNFIYCPWCGKPLVEPAHWEESIEQSCTRLDRFFEKKIKSQRFAAMEDKLNQLELEIEGILRREKK